MIGQFKIIVIAGATMSAVAAFWYVSGLRADLERSQQNVRTLEDSVQQQVQLIDQMQADQQAIMDSRREIQELIDDQRETIDNLRSRFNESANGSERDFGELALAKPGLVENIINKASATAIRCMEIASGSEMTQEEIDANLISECSFSSSP